MSSVIRTLILCIVISTAATANAVMVGVEPGQPWIGFMNVLELPSNGGAFVFGSGWGTADLSATFSGPILMLTPNSINDPAPFWYTPVGGPGATGNKNMDATMYVEQTGPLAGQTVTFAGNVLANTLVSPYTSVAFIKDYAPDYSSSINVTAPLVNGLFSISLATLADPSRHVLYGFETIGPNVWATDVASKGSVQITVPEPATLALLALTGLALLRRRK
jgi:hypothetical protein